MYLGGHGTRGLYKADVPLISNDVCTYLMDRTIPATEVCAGRKHGGVDTCQVCKYQHILLYRLYLLSFIIYFLLIYNLVFYPSVTHYFTFIAFSYFFNLMLKSET